MKRLAGRGEIGRARREDEPREAVFLGVDFGGGVGLDAEGGALVDAEADVAGFFLVGPVGFVGGEATEKGDETAEAGAGHEVGVGDDADERRGGDEVAAEGDAAVVGVGEGGGAGDRVVKRGEIVLAENGEAGAGAAEGFARAEVGVEGGADGSVFPVGDVFALIAAGHEDAVGFGDDLEDARIAGGGGVVELDGLDGIDAADFGENEILVAVPAGSAEDDEVAATGAGDEPFPGGGDVAAAAGEEETGARFGRSGIGGIAGEPIVVGGGGGGDEWRRRGQEGDEKRDGPRAEGKDFCNPIGYK